MLHILFLATILLAGGPASAETHLISRYTLPSENQTYGGFSAIHIGDKGASMIALSDRGGFVVGTVERDEDGVITHIDVSEPLPLKTLQSSPRGAANDAEGVAVADDGTIYVSFEGNHRVGVFASATSPEIPIPPFEAFNAFSGNGGLEALAIDADGTLFAMPERTPRRRDPFPVFRYQNGQWDQPYAIPRTDGYLMVGADFGPDGQLFVLERRFSSVGFFTRVRRVDLEAGTAEVILETGLGVHGNMEGISVWENPSGETIMTLIADDNYRRILSNEIAEYRIDG